MNYFPNRDGAYRIMPGPACQPALRDMVPDLPDIGWREPPSAAVFGGISLVHEAAAISTSAAYPSPAPITARAARVSARAIGNRLRRAYAARSDAFAGVNKERQAAFTSQNYCDNKIAPVARYRPDPDGCCFAGRSKPAPAEHS